MQSPNIFTNFLAIADVLNDEDLYEVRTENDGTGKVIFIGKNINPNADPALATWYIKKITYDVNGFLIRIQLPVDGIGFKYAWDLRATYFS